MTSQNLTSEPKSFSEYERAQLDRYRKLALVSSDWFWETDVDFILTYISDSVERITGVSKNSYIGVSRFDLPSEQTLKTKSWVDHVAQVHRHEPIKNFEYKYVSSSGKSLYLRVNATPIFKDDGTFTGYLGSTTDISELVLAHKTLESINAQLAAQAIELKAAKQSAEMLAHTDGLTQLSNRRGFFASAAIFADLAQRYGHLYSVIMLDLDFFKKVNDMHGHAIGDKVLQAVADAIRYCSRTSDISGRLGGEEFVIILPQTLSDRAHKVAVRLRQKIADISIVAPKGDVTLTASFGISQCKDNEKYSIEDMINIADTALYQAKNQGRDRIIISSD